MVACGGGRNYSTDTAGDHYVVSEGVLKERYLALRGPDQRRAELVGKDLLAQMRKSREEKHPGADAGAP